MAQIHSFYITNMKSELKFSINENEFETTINEISEALIENTDLFDEEEENNNDDYDTSFDLSDEEDESNLNDLLIAELMDLNFYDNNEPENNSFLDDQQLSENDGNSDIDLEAILDKELQK
ncbi:hypothetical protein F8M41_000190 [Gigaspora margarita]|uniref:Uncharacterized protein n=1 Tax=Gigaspora margarita TaxID=4874 RepID=A0A8H3XIY7_GIGMA|nr:hypothetical protein F8M41_000190 [Gigaspora margarita]